MKTLTLVTFIVTLLLPIQIFSQTDNKYRLIPDRLLEKRINSITKPDEQNKQRLQSENFSNSESRTMIKKIKLDNGFLLIEEIQQQWDGSNWVNYWKSTYVHDVNNNMVERLGQHWNGSNW
jgi:hypothetical protein